MTAAIVTKTTAKLTCTQILLRFILLLFGVPRLRGPAVKPAKAGTLNLTLYDVIFALKVVQTKLIFVGAVFVLFVICGELYLPAARDHLCRHLSTGRSPERHVRKIGFLDRNLANIALAYAEAVSEIMFCCVNG